MMNKRTSAGRRRVPGAVAGVALAALLLPGGVEAQPYTLGERSAYLMDRDAEISLARTAGPASVSEDATVLHLLTDGTYETAVRGSNGWTCFVGRGWTGGAPVVDGRRVLGEAAMSPVIRGPQCFNELATRSVLAWHRFTTRRLFGGLDTEQVEDAVQAALESGELSLPEPGAMSYMLSSEQILTPRGGRWVPHIMLYTPFANGRELYGTEGPDMSLPFVTDQGGPWAITVVVVREFSDGSRIETR